MQCVRTIVPPMVTATATPVNVTTSILQSTLSQAPNLLHSQLTSGEVQYKTGALPIDSKNAELEALPSSSTFSKKDSDGLQSKLLLNDKPSSSDIGKIVTNSHRLEESQNVLLKQLLQNTACATTTLPSSTSQGPNLPLVPSLEAQLARPVPPTPSSLLPPLLNELPVSKTPPTKQVLTKETSFVSAAAPSKMQISTPKDETPKAPPAQQQVTTSSLNIQAISRSLETLAKQQVHNQHIKTLSLTIPGSQPGITTSTIKQTISTPPTMSENSTAQQEGVVSHSPNVSTTETMITAVSQPQQRISTSVSVSRHLIMQTKPVVSTATLKSAPTTSEASNLVQANQQFSSTSITPKPVTSEAQSQLSVPQKPPTPIQQQQPQSQQQQKPQKQQQQQSPIVSTIQPSVPQTATHTMSRPQAQMPQSTITPHTVPLMEVKKEILDEVLPSGSSVPLNDTKDFLPAKEELVDGSIDDKNGLFLFYF